MSAFRESPFDKISRSVTSALQKFQDVGLKVYGTKTSVLRIEHTAPDIFGQTDESLRTAMINNVVIAYPFNAAELYGKRTTGGAIKYQFRALDMWEFLPITMSIPFFESDNNETGTYENTPVELEVGDLIVDVMWDHTQSKIPIIMEVTRPRGTFNNKFLVGRKYELALKRGIREPDIQSAITDYIDTITFLGE